MRDFGFRVGVLLKAAEWGVLKDCVFRYHDFDKEDWDLPKGKLADRPLDRLCTAPVVAHVCFLGVGEHSSDAPCFAVPVFSYVDNALRAVWQHHCAFDFSCKSSPLDARCLDYEYGRS